MGVCVDSCVYCCSEALYKQQLSKQASLLEEADRERSVLQQERDSCVSETREARTEYA